jgi:hypothetical protein
LKTYRVGTFCHWGARRTPRVMAYTLWYNPQWASCIEYDIEAPSGTEAKKQAIAKRKAFELNAVAIESGKAACSSGISDE